MRCSRVYVSVYVVHVCVCVCAFYVQYMLMYVCAKACDSNMAIRPNVHICAQIHGQSWKTVVAAIVAATSTAIYDCCLLL